MQHLEWMKQKDNTLEQKMRAQKEAFRQFRSSFRSDPGQVTVIPVVVHVVYNDPTQRISEQQVRSQIDALNEDFGRRNADTVNTPSIFKSRAANTNIRFCLASKNPVGIQTNGIDYVETTVTSFTSDDDIKKNVTGGADAWDVNRYFNIWVGNLSGTLLGYAEFPTTPLQPTYGVVIHYESFGRSGTASPPYNRGRTATHEIGHCLYMFHIWGDEPACQDDDDIADTPKQKDSNFGCPSFPQGPSRPGGCCDSASVSSMYMNYMDYTDDACMNMWTRNQGEEMNAAIAFFLPGLITSNVCQGSLSVKDDHAEPTITISPNPSYGRVNISFSNSTERTADIRIYNSLGKLVHAESRDLNKPETIELSALPAGLYFIDLKTTRHSVTKRFTIAR